jgi:hypothetical protein
MPTQGPLKGHQTSGVLSSSFYSRSFLTLHAVAAAHRIFYSLQEVLRAQAADLSSAPLSTSDPPIIDLMKAKEEKGRIESRKCIWDAIMMTKLDLSSLWQPLASFPSFHSLRKPRIRTSTPHKQDPTPQI